MAHPDASVPAVTATYALPSPLRAGDANSQAKVEISLPLPPSGDYDLNLTAEQIGAIVEKRYGQLLQTLALSPRHLARLSDLLAERLQATVDAANAAVLTGLDPVRDLSTIRRAIEEVQAGIDTRLRNELGEPIFAAYRDFDSSIRERNSVGDFARLLAEAREPLQPDQERQLVQILKTFPGRDAPMDISRAIFDGINTRARISEEAIAAATAMLSSRQLDAFRKLQGHWRAEDARR